MNSSQRRQDRRLWSYSVVTSVRTYEEYDQRWTWLADRYGRKNSAPWRERTHSWHDYTTRWEFKNKRDAVEFALRWR
jgi:hypothetical protein